MVNVTKDKRAQFSEKFDHLIDSNGNRVEYDDPRVVHVFPIDISITIKRLMEKIYAKRGWSVRYSPNTDMNTLNYAKKISSGRECLPCKAIMGATYFDMCNNRGKDEITLYYNLDQEGPCQNGAWPLVWDTIAKRTDSENVVFLVHPRPKTDYLGQDPQFARELGLVGTVGDIIEEAKTTVRCLALDKDTSFTQFEKETDAVIESAYYGVRALIKALKTWAKNCSRIALKETVENTPKVLIFGGLNVMFVQYPVSEFFENRGIIPKVIDFTELNIFLVIEAFVRYGFMSGRVTPKEQFKTLPCLHI